ncbi:hypothetical protein [Taibaiella koreensis]|uniref:hypothetical protein n=1 Tax=Taibaiella koreensis TaxID=1268548 RepID=UPI0013C2DB3C|nr:hypothetical protein [Taibaiella koreensis]
MRWIILLLSLFNGLFMLGDGIYVLCNGKYIGPEKPGPWALLFYRLHIDVFRLGPLFIVYGLLWLLFVYSFGRKKSRAYPMGIVVALSTLWYLPVGALFSLIVLILLLLLRKRSRI